MDATHASFFSGVGGLDLGLERAGWRTVSHSEIDPYASAVLAERWPGIPNLGDITRLAESVGQQGQPDYVARAGGDDAGHDAPPSWHGATLWSGGFPCQDLSVAGKRAGFEGERSSLAFAFLDLVERYRPPAILLENVPGLLTSNGGRDAGRLFGEMGQLGYWWAYRILDAQYAGVPQRRRRVFVVALDAARGFGADSAGAVLAVGARCSGHSPARQQAGPTAAFGLGGSPDIAGSLTRRYGKGVNSTLDDGAIAIGAPPDPGGVRAADGLAGRLDHQQPVAFVKRGRAQTNEDAESWGAGDVMPTLNAWDVGDARTTAAIIGPGREPREPAGYDLLPLGLDSHRYRCCGNGVVAPVAEWIGRRLLAVLA
jgi:DNA (cytosine-5)-methyltransferase 1